MAGGASVQQVVARQHVPGVLVGGGVGAGGSGGDNIQGVADDVGEYEGGGTGWVRQAGYIAGFRLLQVLAQGIDLLMSRPTAQQQGGQALQVVQGQAWRGGR